MPRITVDMHRAVFEVEAIMRQVRVAMSGLKTGDAGELDAFLQRMTRVRDLLKTECNETKGTEQYIQYLG